MSDLGRILGPDLVRALQQLVDDRVAEALAAQTGSNGESPWMTLDAASQYLHVSPRTLTRLLESRRIRSAYLGRRRLLHRDDLDAYLRGGIA